MYLIVLEIVKMGGRPRGPAFMVPEGTTPAPKGRREATNQSAMTPMNHINNQHGTRTIKVR